MPFGQDPYGNPTGDTGGVVVDGGGASGPPASPESFNTTSMILILASQQLEDITSTTWDQVGVLLPYLNLGIIEIINLKPEAYTLLQLIELIAGALQSLPDGDFSLVDAICNMGSNGTTQGQTITTVEKSVLDSVLPGWMTWTQAAVVSQVVIDDRLPRNFWVFPPNLGGQQIQVLDTAKPDPLVNNDDIFPLDDSYMPAAVDYIVGRALLEETTIPNAQAKGKTFLQKFLTDLGSKKQVDEYLEERGK